MTPKQKIDKCVCLQETIRRQFVFIPNDYQGTIDPAVVRFVPSAGYAKIASDTYGPFCPEAFFRPETDRIIFVMKESYYSGTVGDDGYRGCDKAKTYGILDWNELGQDNVKLYKNAARCAFRILEGRQMDIYSPTDREMAVKRLRENVAFLNVNFFPLICQTGKSRRSKDGLIFKWAQNNRLLITKLINLYDAHTIIGGRTLTHFCDAENSTLFSQKVNIINSNDTHAAFGKQGIVYYNDDHIFINAFHCSYPLFLNQIDNIAKVRDDWRNGNMSVWE